MKKDPELKIKLGEEYNKVMNILEYFLKTRKKYLEMIRFIELLENVYNQEQNKLVILAEELNHLARIAIKIADKKGIHSLVIQHGSVIGDAFFKEIIAEKIAVSGEREKDFLVSQGTNLKKIKITGNPRYDAMIKKKKEEACNELRFNSNKKIIVFAAQYIIPGDRIVQNAIEEFLRAINQIENKEDFEFIIKLHPGGGEGYIPKIDKKLKIKMIKDIDLYTLLCCCDILITGFSMVGTEAVLLNRPVISIQIGRKSDLINYENEGVGINICEKNKLIDAMKKVLYDKKFKKKFIKSRKKFIKDFAYKIDGKATKRIINLINLLKK